MEEIFDNLEKLNKKYRESIKEAINIRSMRYPLTSIFVCGRTIETILDDLIKKAIKNKKIGRVNLRRTRYEDKIGKLKGIKIIDDKTFHELNSIRIDRNETGHPIKNERLRDENKVIIDNSIILIRKL